MGGCCCCSSKETDSNNGPAYYYYPRASEEHVPLSSPLGASSALSTGLLVDTNLDTSIPDTYRSPPMPIPYDVALRSPHTPPVVQETSIKCEGMKESDCKKNTDFELDESKESEVEHSKSMESIVVAIEEEDVCPICLEEYESTTQRIRNLPQNASIIFIWRAFWNGWKEVILSCV